MTTDDSFKQKFIAVYHLNKEAIRVEFYHSYDVDSMVNAKNSLYEAIYLPCCGCGVMTKPDDFVFSSSGFVYHKDCIPDHTAPVPCTVENDLYFRGQYMQLVDLIQKLHAKQYYCPLGPEDYKIALTNLRKFMHSPCAVCTKATSDSVAKCGHIYHAECIGHYLDTLCPKCQEPCKYNSFVR